MPFGFKANLWKVDEPLPVHKFNTAKFDEIGTNPRDTMGYRDEITSELFCDFSIASLRFNDDKLPQPSKISIFL